MCKQHAQCMTFKIYVRTWYRSEASMQRTRNNLRRFLQLKQTYCPPIPNKPTLQAPNLWKYDFSFNIFWVLTVLEKGHVLALFRIHFGVHSCSFSANAKRIKKESLCISGSQPLLGNSRSVCCESYLVSICSKDVRGMRAPEYFFGGPYVLI
jgi:hypothetical protein